MKETEVKLLSLIDGKLQENQTNAIKMYAQVFKFKNIFSLMFVLYLNKGHPKSWKWGHVKTIGIIPLYLNGTIHNNDHIFMPVL